MVTHVIPAYSTYHTVVSVCEAEDELKEMGLLFVYYVYL